MQDELKKKEPATLAERLKPLEQEQKAIHDAADRLSTPRANEDARGIRSRRPSRRAKAAESMDKAHTEEAANHLEQAKQALERLADRTPPLNQRKEQALREIAQLRQKQEEIAKQTEQARKTLKTPTRKTPRRKKRLVRSCRKRPASKPTPPKNAE